MTPRCTKCFRRDWENDVGVFTELTLTGNAKRSPVHGLKHGPRYNVLHVQVQCEKCKRRWWSHHPMLQHQWEHEFGEKK